jgi:hypothetical protein
MLFEQTTHMLYEDPLLDFGKSICGTRKDTTTKERIRKKLYVGYTIPAANNPLSELKTRNEPKNLNSIFHLVL